MTKVFVFLVGLVLLGCGDETTNKSVNIATGPGGGLTTGSGSGAPAGGTAPVSGGVLSNDCGAVVVILSQAKAKLRSGAPLWSLLPAERLALKQDIDTGDDSAVSGGTGTGTATCTPTTTNPVAPIPVPVLVPVPVQQS